jgi:hypothetical protein
MYSSFTNGRKGRLEENKVQELNTIKQKDGKY